MVQHFDQDFQQDQTQQDCLNEINQGIGDFKGVRAAKPFHGEREDHGARHVEDVVTENFPVLEKLPPPDQGSTRHHLADNGGVPEHVIKRKQALFHLQKLPDGQTS